MTEYRIWDGSIRMGFLDGVWHDKDAAQEYAGRFNDPTVVLMSREVTEWEPVK